MEVLVVAAHPDDEVLGLGGTIVKHSLNGDNVHLLIITDGSTSQYHNDPCLQDILKEKKEETRKCAEILGIKSIDYGMLPDMKLDMVEHITINSCIEQAIENYKPDIVYTHFFGDINKDHQKVSESTLVAARPVGGQCVKKVYYYRTPSSTEWNTQTIKNSFIPNVFVDITRYVSIKQAAIACYTKELRDYPHPRCVKSVDILDKATGITIGCMAAEAFMLAREIR